MKKEYKRHLMALILWIIGVGLIYCLFYNKIAVIGGIMILLWANNIETRIDTNKKIVAMWRAPNNNY